jgi:hypothetical protein
MVVVFRQKKSGYKLKMVFVIIAKETIGNIISNEDFLD